MANESPQSMPAAKPVNPGSEAARAGDAGHIAQELEKLDTQDHSRIFVVAGAALAVLAVALAVVWLVSKPRPKGTGSIEEAFAVALPEDKVLTTVRVGFANIGAKPLWIREIKVQLTAADGQQYSDTAASAADFERYFSAYPELRGHSIEPLKLETKVAPGGQIRGSVVAAFPVTLDGFNNRKALAVTVVPYSSFVAPEGGDAVPIVITQPAR